MHGSDNKQQKAKQMVGVTPLCMSQVGVMQFVC